MDAQSNNMPSLWVFLVIVLAVLLAVVIGTSFVMHMIQRRQRRQLQRRIAAGEVDLEALGIKRLNVPQDEIEKMPQYTFRTVGEGETDGSTADNHDSQTAFFQPTCSICLDDFQYGQTLVRELPCKHIFHPDCIDPFLRENSSLCPLCKRSALPPGYCPVAVTNIMVRRERLSRRIRDGRDSYSRQPTIRYQPPRPPNALERRLERIRGPSAVSAPQQAHIRHGEPALTGRETETELGPIESRTSLANQPADADQPPPEIARRGTIARRAWRRERVASLHAREYEAQANEARMIDERRPLCKLCHSFLVILLTPCEGRRALGLS